MKMIYLSCPMYGENRKETNKNIARAYDAMAYLLIELAGEATVVCPNRNFGEFSAWGVDDEINHHAEMLRKSDAVVMLSGWENDQVCMAERKIAEELGMKIFGDEKGMLYQICQWMKIRIR